MQRLEPGFLLVVHNDAIPSGLLTVHLVGMGPGGQFLGAVPPESTGSFRVDPAGLSSGWYRLRGERISGPDVVSEEFTVAGAREVTWFVQSNMVNVRRVGSDRARQRDPS